MLLVLCLLLLMNPVDAVQGPLYDPLKDFHPDYMKSTIEFYARQCEYLKSQGRWSDNCELGFGDVDKFSYADRENRFFREHEGGVKKYLYPDRGKRFSREHKRDDKKILYADRGKRFFREHKRDDKKFLYPDREKRFSREHKRDDKKILYADRGKKMKREKNNVLNLMKQKQPKHRLSGIVQRNIEKK